MLAELLGLPFTGPVLSLEPDATGRRSAEPPFSTTPAPSQVVVDLPAVVAVAERSCPPAKAPAESWPPADAVRRVTTADLAPGRWGLPGSPTKVAQVHPAPLTRDPVIFRGRPQTQASRAITELLARGCFEAPTAQVGRSRAHPAGPWATEVVALVGPGPVAGTRALLGAAAALAVRGRRRGDRSKNSAQRRRSRAVGRRQRGDAEWRRAAAGGRCAGRAGSANGRRGPCSVRRLPWDREVLARLAVASGAGLMSDLVSLSVTPGTTPRLAGLKPSGGGTLAEIVSHGSPQIATLRTGLLPLRKPRADRRTHRAPAARRRGSGDPPGRASYRQVTATRSTGPRW